MPPKPTTKGRNVGLKKGTTELPPDTEIIAGLPRASEAMFPVPQPAARDTGKRPRSQDSSPSGSDHSDDEISVFLLRPAPPLIIKNQKLFRPS